MPRKAKPLMSPDQLADLATASLLQGKSLRNDPKLGPASDKDRLAVTRITGEAVEVFNARISEKLRIICDKSAERIEEKLDQDAFKPGELGFIFSVAHDKRQALDGNHQLHASAVNVQVNLYSPNGPSKHDILATLGSNETRSQALIPEATHQEAVRIVPTDTESQQAQVVDAIPPVEQSPQSQQAKP